MNEYHQVRRYYFWEPLSFEVVGRMKTGKDFFSENAASENERGGPKVNVESGNELELLFIIFFQERLKYLHENCVLTNLSPRYTLGKKNASEIRLRTLIFPLSSWQPYGSDSTQTIMYSDKARENKNKNKKTDQAYPYTRIIVMQ